MTEEVWVQQLRMFHFATGLPLQWLKMGQAVMTLPADIEHVGMLLDERESFDLFEALCLMEVEQHELRYMATSFEELFFCYRPSAEDWLLCGPYCHSDFLEKDVLRLIRSMHLKLEKKETLRQYYESLLRLSEVNIYYDALLLRRLVSGESQRNTPAALPKLPENPEQGLYQNAYRNRMMRFHHPPFFFEEEIRRQIVAANQAQALQLLSELNTLERAHLADTPLRSLKNSIIGSVVLFTRAAIAGGVPVDEAFTLSDQYIQLVEKQTDLAALSAIEEAILQRFIERVAVYRKQKYSALVRKAISYIDEYLTAELTAAAIAAKLFVHPDYLSARFSQEVGETLHRFVLRRRMQEAAHFMRYSEESISSIAIFYRFSSQSHFISVFKKFYGMTPQQYREQ